MILSCHLLHAHLRDHFLLHLIQVGSLLLLRRCQNVHSFEIQRTDSSHECLFQRFLHMCLLVVVLSKLVVGIFQFLAEHLNLLLVGGADQLDFVFHSQVEPLLLLLLFEGLVLLNPSLEDLSGPQLFVVTSSISQDNL